MIRLILLAALGWGPVAEPGPMAEPAARAWAIADAVMSHHLDPPTRPQMILTGIRGMARASGVAEPNGLARRVSDLSGPGPLADLMAEVLAGPKVEANPPRRGRPSPGPGMTPEAAFFEGLFAVVPGGATLMPEKERKVQESFEANLYVGIQVRLGVDEKAKRPVFAEILRGGPAEKAGAKAGDLIEEVGGESTDGMPLAGVVDRLRGPEGTEVVVRFRRPSTGEDFARSMTRGRLPRATVQGLSPNTDKGWEVRFDGPAPIGYLKITEVAGSTPRELRAFASRLESEGVEALVLDLREAQSAHFHPTVLLADALLDGGVIGRVRSAGGEKTYRAEPDSLFRGWPMVVLASRTSEPEVAWLCEALRDNRRATILGDPTPSRDPTFTEAVPLPGGEWSVRMATGRLERGDGRPLDGPGPEDRRDQILIEAAPRAASDPPAYLVPKPDRAVPTESPAPDPLPKAREILEGALKAGREVPGG